MLLLKPSGSSEQIVRVWPETGKLQPFPAFLATVDVSAPMRVFPNGREVAYFGRFGAPESADSRGLYVLDLASGKARALDPRADTDDRSLLSLPIAVSADGVSVITLAKHDDTYDLVDVRSDGTPGHRVLFPCARTSCLGTSILRGTGRFTSIRSTARTRWCAFRRTWEGQSK
jgi:hypothetical protein